MLITYKKVSATGGQRTNTLFSKMAPLMAREPPFPHCQIAAVPTYGLEEMEQFLRQVLEEK